MPFQGRQASHDRDGIKRFSGDLRMLFLKFFQINTAGNIPDAPGSDTQMLDHMPADHLAGDDHQLWPAHDLAEHAVAIISMTRCDKRGPRPAAGEIGDPCRHPGTRVHDIRFFILDDRA